MVPRAAPGQLHPPVSQLERLLRGELSRQEARDVVRHLLRGCRQCAALTRWLWRLGEEEEPQRFPRAEAQSRPRARRGFDVH